MEREPADPCPAARGQRFAQRPIGVGLVARADEVGLLVEDRVDLARVDELRQLDHPAAVAGRRLDLLVVKHDTATLVDLEPLDGVIGAHLLAVLRAHAAMLDPCPILACTS